MTRPKRGPWAEVELRGEHTDLVLAHPGWTNDREALITAVKESGWFHYSLDAFLASAAAELSWGWVGVDEELNLVECSSEGLVADTGEIVTDVVQATLARIHPERPD